MRYESRSKYGEYIVENNYASIDGMTYFSCFQVFPEYRGKGYARRLLKSALRVTKRMGYNTMWFNVDNPAVNVPFYEKMGARRIEGIGGRVSMALGVTESTL